MGVDLLKGFGNGFERIALEKRETGDRRGAGAGSRSDWIQERISMTIESSQNENRAPGAEDEAKERLIAGAEQQVGAGEQVEGPQQTGEQAGPESVAAGADPGGEIPSAAEAEDRGAAEQRLKDDEEAAELDEALDESFPASDPPSLTTKGRAK
jgi:hypothetical protein